MRITQPVLTIDCAKASVLRQKATPIAKNEFGLAREISGHLFRALQPYIPAAGLAAPQIGFSKAIFIYSYDRRPEHLITIVNPAFESMSTSVLRWEGCLSTMKAKKLAHVPRFEKIKASYQTLEGIREEKMLEGFAAHVFQHEYDHLQGIVNVERTGAQVKIFENEDDLLHFMAQIKKEDASRY